jgi:hypothetical protein
MTDRYAAFAELVRNRLAVVETSALLNRREESSSGFGEPQVAPSKRLRLAAVEAQAALARQAHAAAELAVNSMLNQMISLAQAAPWWSADSDAAIAETVDYAGGNHEVASTPAQRAWEWCRSARASFDIRRPRFYHGPCGYDRRILTSTRNLWQMGFTTAGERDDALKLVNDLIGLAEDRRPGLRPLQARRPTASRRYARSLEQIGRNWLLLWPEWTQEGRTRS